MAHHPPLDRRVQEREAEQRKKRADEVKRLEQEAVNRASWENWFKNSLAAALTKDWFESHVTAALVKEAAAFMDSLGLVLCCAREEYRPRLAALEAGPRTWSGRSASKIASSNWSTASMPDSLPATRPSADQR